MFAAGLYLLVGLCWTLGVVVQKYRRGVCLVPDSDNGWINVGMAIGAVLSVCVWPLFVILVIKTMIRGRD